ncbi:hypothetical protein KL939_004233 [Ogataea angusta]|nr:hypothetical protein KL939_004233 [Ogataea angusta]
MKMPARMPGLLSYGMCYGADDGTENTKPGLHHHQERRGEVAEAERLVHNGGLVRGRVFEHVEENSHHKQPRDRVFDGFDELVGFEGFLLDRGPGAAFDATDDVHFLLHAEEFRRGRVIWIDKEAGHRHESGNEPDKQPVPFPRSPDSGVLQSVRDKPAWDVDSDTRDPEDGVDDGLLLDREKHGYRVLDARSYTGLEKAQEKPQSRQPAITLATQRAQRQQTPHRRDKGHVPGDRQFLEHQVRRELAQQVSDIEIRLDIVILLLRQVHVLKHSGQRRITDGVLVHKQRGVDQTHERQHREPELADKLLFLLRTDLCHAGVVLVHQVKSLVGVLLGDFSVVLLGKEPAFPSGARLQGAHLDFLRA